jgi:hypothetical protein
MMIGRLTQQFLNHTSLGAHSFCWEPKMEGAAAPKKPTRKFKYLTLEPRVMFDGAMADTADQVQHEMSDLPDFEPRFVDYALFDALAEPSVAPTVVKWWKRGRCSLNLTRLTCCSRKNWHV